MNNTPLTGPPPAPPLDSSTDELVVGVWVLPIRAGSAVLAGLRSSLIRAGRGSLGLAYQGWKCRSSGSTRLSNIIISRSRNKKGGCFIPRWAYSPGSSQYNINTAGHFQPALAQRRPMLPHMAYLETKLAGKLRRLFLDGPRDPTQTGFGRALGA